MKRPAVKRPAAAASALQRPAASKRRCQEEQTSSHSDKAQAQDDDMMFPTSEEEAPPSPHSQEIFAASDAEPAEQSPADPTATDLTFLKINGVGVENWTRWAFTEHKDKAIITDFLKTLQACSRKAEFSDGIPIASICSGWGVAEMVIDAINEVLDDVCPRSPKFYTAFMCERETWKATYLTKAHPSVKLLFRDMQELGKGEAFDVISGAKVKVPFALGLVAGYPCRTISPQNPKQKSFKDRSSSTGCGYHSTMKYIERSPELVFALLENVQAMFFNWKQFGDECPMQIQTETMRKLGFQPAFSVCVNSSDYGLAQSRSRAWVLYIRGTHMKSSLSGECLMGTLKFNAEKLGLSAFLNAKQAQCPDQNGPKKAKKGKGDGEKWKDAFKNSCEELGSEAVHGNLELLEKLTKNVDLTRRELCLLASAVTEMQRSGLKPYDEQFCIQLDQNWGRQTWLRKTPKLLPCLLPHGKYICSGRWTLLGCREKARFQGIGDAEYHKYHMDSLTSNQLGDLAGNSFAAPIFLSGFLTAVAMWDP